MKQHVLAGTITLGVLLVLGFCAALVRFFPFIAAVLATSIVVAMVVGFLYFVALAMITPLKGK